MKHVMRVVVIIWSFVFISNMGQAAEKNKPNVEQNCMITYDNPSQVVSIEIKDRKQAVTLNITPETNVHFVPQYSNKEDITKFVFPAKTPSYLAYHFSWRIAENTEELVRVIGDHVVNDGSSFETKVYVICSGLMQKLIKGDGKTGNDTWVGKTWNAKLFEKSEGNALIILATPEFERAAIAQRTHWTEQGYKVTKLDYPVDPQKVPSDLVIVVSIGHGGGVEYDDVDHKKRTIMMQLWANNDWFLESAEHDAIVNKLWPDYDFCSQRDLSEYFSVLNGKLKAGAVVTIHHCYSGTPYPENSTKTLRAAVQRYLAKTQPDLSVYGVTGEAKCTTDEKEIHQPLTVDSPVRFIK